MTVDMKSVIKKAFNLAMRLVPKRATSYVLRHAIQHTNLQFSFPINRQSIATKFLSGDGIEIGALHHPLPVPATARVRYLDRMSRDDLVRHYTELAGTDLVPVDIVDNGETLATVTDNACDFVIANHFLEHCENPLLALQNMVRVLKRNGILYLAIPDKRFTFDVDRPLTPFSHLVDDYNKGPEHSRRAHFEEFAQYVHKIQDPEQIRKNADAFIENDRSIHFHVWSGDEIIELIQNMKSQFALQVEVELIFNNNPEWIVILRKS